MVIKFSLLFNSYIFTSKRILSVICMLGTGKGRACHVLSHVEVRIVVWSCLAFVARAFTQ